MPILDASLAFALTMLLVATVVTQLVKLLHNLFNRRSGEFTKMLKQFYEDELQPVVDSEMNRLSSEVEAGVTEGIRAAAKKIGIGDLVPKGKELNELTELSTIELRELLKRSQMGAEILKNLGDRAETVFDALGQRYDAVGERFTNSFRHHARQWATGVALVLALVLNIDSLFILDTYLNNESARNAVIAQSDSLIAGVQSLQEELKSGERALLTEADLGNLIEDTQENVSKLHSTDFPIGYDYFPYSLLTGEADAETQRRNNLNGRAMWFLGVLLTAFCAGLGAPFWYDTVTGIARVMHRGSNRE